MAFTGPNRDRWIAGGFALVVVIVAVFVGVQMLLPAGLSLPASLQVSPAEITLCPGQGRQFRAADEGRSVRGIQWEASDGLVGPQGFYVAPTVPGDFRVTARHPATGFLAVALVHVVPCADGTPAPAILPTAPPTATPAPPTAMPPPPTPAPTQTQATSPTPAALLDGSGDLVAYDTLTPVAAAPPGADIRLACFDAERRFVETLPEELAVQVADWDTAQNLILWMAFHEPIPVTSDMEQYWLFSLETDGDDATGRPREDGVINPDMSPEVTVGVHSDPATGLTFSPYLMVWNAQIGDSEYRTIEIETRLSPARDVLFVRVPWDALAALVRELSQAQPDRARLTGRAATLTTIAEGKVADFFPERP